MNDQTENQATETTEATTSAETHAVPVNKFHARKSRIRERVAGKNVFKKYLEYYVPTLDQICDTLPAPDSWSEEKLEDDKESCVQRTPVYAAQHLQIIQDAIISEVLSIARRIDKGVGTQCTNWEELISHSAGGGTKYPALCKAFKELFAAWLVDADGGNFNETQGASILSYTNPEKLAVQVPERQARFAEVLNTFIATLEDEAIPFTSVINNIAAAMEAKEEDTSWD